MGKFIKRVFVDIAVALLILGVFVAGYYFGPSVAKKIGFKLPRNTAEAYDYSEPHTAEDVTRVNEVEPMDETGAGEIEVAQHRVPYVLDVDFGPVLLKEAQMEKKLIVMTQKATASQTAKKDGLFSLSLFRQTKAILFHGEGTYFVDLSTLTSDDFVIDKDRHTITIYIPKPQFTVSLQADETEFFDSANGTLRFGEMEISPEVMATLEAQGIVRITEILDADAGIWDMAYKFAKLCIKEIYEPLIAAQIDAAMEKASDEYAVAPNYTILVEIR